MISQSAEQTYIVCVEAHLLLYFVTPYILASLFAIGGLRHDDAVSISETAPIRGDLPEQPVQRERLSLDQTPGAYLPDVLSSYHIPHAFRFDIVALILVRTSHRVLVYRAAAVVLSIRPHTVQHVAVACASVAKRSVK